MRDSLRSKFAIRRLSAREQNFRGELPVKELKRLGELLWDDSGMLEYRLAFSIGANDFVCVLGELRGFLMLQCQRSLKPFAWPLATRVRTILVASEMEEQRTDEQDDVRMCPNGEVTILDLIEDEVLLALPVVAVNSQATMPENPAAEPNANQRSTAFSVLKSWRRK